MRFTFAGFFYSVPELSEKSFSIPRSCSMAVVLVVMDVTSSSKQVVLIVSSRISLNRSSKPFLNHPFFSSHIFLLDMSAVDKYCKIETYLKQWGSYRGSRGSSYSPNIWEILRKFSDFGVKNGQIVGSAPPIRGLSELKVY